MMRKKLSYSNRKMLAKDRFIKDLDVDGIWDKLDCLYINEPITEKDATGLRRFHETLDFKYLAHVKQEWVSIKSRWTILKIWWFNIKYFLKIL